MLSIKGSEFKKQVLTEIENNLWRLGDSNSSVFPNFDLDSHELEYGVQRNGNEFLVETEAMNKNGERVLAKITVKLIV